MFETLSDRLSTIFDALRKQAALSEADVDAALREVRRALLEADVALPVARDFIARVRTRAVGQEVIKSITPGQMVIKIVHDNLVEMLGSTSQGIDLNAPSPVPVLMVGLQGSGKTTTTAKLALRFQTRDRKKVLMASLDVARPAAQQQLKVLGEQAKVATLPIIAGQMPVDIAKRALEAARLGGFDVVMLDTAGRTHVDEALMAEIAAVRAAVNPHETLLVADSLTGQDAVNVASSFNARTPLTGIILTRVDGDGRGGAALSMRMVTGCAIKAIGTGEKLDALEDFHPDRIAGRILGQGDVVSLVEKATESFEMEKAEKLAKKMQKGEFDLDDMAEQLAQMRKMGGMQGLLGMLPGIGKMKNQIAAAGLDDKLIKRQEAIVHSMTREERRKPKILNGSRKRRIAEGSGTSVPEVNKLLKTHRQMADMMKQVGKKGMKGLLGGLTGLGGGAPGLSGLGGGLNQPGMPPLPPGFPGFKR
ncbi:MAG TPA: signal recognition particle protein [Alphaproteobacteria bacterium]|nr:signal recognition particle protein [Alphaproteobacteria bacterium]